MSKFEIVSKEYRSNCMFEALKAKMHNPKVKVYFCKPLITENGHFQMFHFMWSDGKEDYDFSNSEDGNLPWYKCFFFKGYLKKFNFGFAEKYVKYRNK